MQQTRPLNTTSPLNRQHHLARGLELWWMATPHTAKGTTWRDMSGRRNDGVFTNIDTTSWSVSPHGENRLALAMIGNTQNRAEAGNIPCLSVGSTAFTISGWNKLNSLKSVIGCHDNSGVGGPFLGRTNTTMYAVVSAFNYGTFDITSFTGDWHYFQAVYNGAGAGNTDRLIVYIDGVPRTLTFSGTIPASIATAGTLFRAGYSPSWAFTQNDTTNDIKVYSRALSETECQIAYRESLAGHPNLLNWLPARRKGAAAGGVGPHLGTMGLLGVGK